MFTVHIDPWALLASPQHCSSDPQQLLIHVKEGRTITLVLAYVISLCYISGKYLHRSL